MAVPTGVAEGLGAAPDLIDVGLDLDPDVGFGDMQPVSQGLQMRLQARVKLVDVGLDGIT